MIIINLYSKNKKVSFISIDVRKKLLYLEHIQGKGQSEPKVAEKQIKEANGNGYKIKKFPENVKVEWQGKKTKRKDQISAMGLAMLKYIRIPYVKISIAI
ncbi:MAG: hypothetical protein QXZ67_02380 [Thermoplasmata archaeon]